MPFDTAVSSETVQTPNTMAVKLFVGLVFLGAFGCVLAGPGPGPGPRLTSLEARQLWMQEDILTASVRYLRHMTGGVDMVRDALQPLMFGEASDYWETAMNDLKEMVESQDDNNERCGPCQVQYI